MNKTLAEILQELLDSKASDPNMDVLDTTSKTSIWRLLFQCVAFALFKFQEACRTFLEEIQTLIKEQKIPTLRWYRKEALRFQYGFELDPNSLTGEFLTTFTDASGNVVTATSDQIEASKIIKYCSVTKSLTSSRILMKIATETNGEIIPIGDTESIAFNYFVSRVQAAGDNITIVNYNPDILQLIYDVCYDPLILNSDGMHKLNGNYPVKDAIQKFLKNLPFNGELSVTRLGEIIMEVDGVVDLLKKSVASKWIDVSLGGYGQFQPIDIAKIPKSGHFKIEDWSGINYIIKTPQE